MERKINRQQERTRRKKAEQRNAWKKKHIQRQLVPKIIPKCVRLKNNTLSYIDAAPYLQNVNSLLQIKLGGYAPVVNLIMSYFPSIVCYECGSKEKITTACDRCSRYYCYRCIDELCTKNFDRYHDMNHDDTIFHMVKCRFCQDCDKCKGVCFCHFNGIYYRQYTVLGSLFGGRQTYCQRGLQVDWWNHKQKIKQDPSYGWTVSVLKTYTL